MEDYEFEFIYHRGARVEEASKASVTKEPLRRWNKFQVERRGCNVWSNVDMINADLGNLRGSTTPLDRAKYLARKVCKRRLKMDGLQTISLFVVVVVEEITIPAPKSPTPDPR